MIALSTAEEPLHLLGGSTRWRLEERGVVGAVGRRLLKRH